MLLFTEDKKLFDSIQEELEEIFTTLVPEKDFYCELLPKEGKVIFANKKIKNSNTTNNILNFCNKNKISFPVISDNSFTFKLSTNFFKALLSEELLEKFKEIHCWDTPNACTPCYLMDLQRLSNCVHLADIFFVCEIFKSDKEKDNFINSVEEVLNYIELLEEELLDYVPMMDWEKRLYEKYFKLKEA